MDQDLRDILPRELDGNSAEVEFNVVRVPLASPDMQLTLQAEPRDLEAGLPLVGVVMIREGPRCD